MARKIIKEFPNCEILMDVRARLEVNVKYK